MMLAGPFRTISRNRCASFLNGCVAGKSPRDAFSYQPCLIFIAHFELPPGSCPAWLAQVPTLNEMDSVGRAFQKIDAIDDANDG